MPNQNAAIAQVRGLRGEVETLLNEVAPSEKSAQVIAKALGDLTEILIDIQAAKSDDARMLAEGLDRFGERLLLCFGPPEDMADDGKGFRGTEAASLRIYNGLSEVGAAINFLARGLARTTSQNN